LQSITLPLCFWPTALGTAGSQKLGASQMFMLYTTYILTNACDIESSLKSLSLGRRDLIGGLLHRLRRKEALSRCKTNYPIHMGSPMLMTERHYLSMKRKNILPAENYAFCDKPFAKYSVSLFHSTFGCMFIPHRPTWACFARQGLIRSSLRLFTYITLRSISSLRRLLDLSRRRGPVKLRTALENSRLTTSLRLLF